MSTQSYHVRKQFLIHYHPPRSSTKTHICKKIFKAQEYCCRLIKHLVWYLQTLFYIDNKSPTTTNVLFFFLYEPQLHQLIPSSF